MTVAYPLLKDGTDVNALGNLIAPVLGVEKDQVIIGVLTMTDHLGRALPQTHIAVIVRQPTTETGTTFERFTKEVRAVIQPFAKGDFKVSFGIENKV